LSGIGFNIKVENKHRKEKDMEQTPLQSTPEPQQKRDVLQEVAGGYTLGATIMAFLSVWGMAVVNLSTQNVL